jgi:phytoene dehydrogenase-like protein
LLYHLLGGGTGTWDVPVGGMGSVSGALAAAASAHGAQILTGAEVVAVTPDGEVRYRVGDDEHRVRGEHVLAGVPIEHQQHLMGRLVHGFADHTLDFAQFVHEVQLGGEPAGRIDHDHAHAAGSCGAH